MVHEACESIAIAADAPSIMAIIADFPAYPQWAGYIKQADVLRTGPTGRAERVHFVLDAGVMRDDYVLEYDWGGNDWVHWALVEGLSLIHISEPTRLLSISYAVFCLKKNIKRIVRGT